MLGNSMHQLGSGNVDSSSDKARAMTAWDCKMAGELRTCINTVLFNYVVILDLLGKLTDSVTKKSIGPGLASIYT